MEPNREAWLTQALDALRPLFTEASYTVPDNIKVTCGFPSRGATSSRNRTIGQCWDSGLSDAKVFEIFISPVIADSGEAIAILAHEIIHAIVGYKAGHKAPFKRCALAIGLAGKMTATHAGAELQAHIDTMLPTLGEYPHGALNPRAKTAKEGTRLLKAECPQCGYTVRVTRKWLDLDGAPFCPADNSQLSV